MTNESATDAANSPTVVTEVHDRVLVIRLEREAKRNAIDADNNIVRRHIAVNDVERIAALIGERVRRF